MTSKPNRRDFFTIVGIGAAGAAVGCTNPAVRSGWLTQEASFRREKRPGPNDRIGLGIIGVGSLGGGWHHLGRCLKMADLDVVAVADVDAVHLDKAVTTAEGKIKGYRDYRQLLDHQDIHAVIIATPDHWHALPAVEACDAGMDVYCEKPLSLTVADGRAMVEAAHRNDTVFQTGTQQRSSERFHKACELVRNGAIGDLRTVKVVLGQGPIAAKEPAKKAPLTLDWNSWLGPAREVPYHQNRCHYKFRWFWDYSGGKLTDWGAHHLDIAQWGIGSELSGPVSVEASGSFPEENFYQTPVDFDVRYDYANGVKLHATGAGKNGVTFVGTEGEIFVNREEISASRDEILDYEVGSGAIRLYKSRDHHQNWIDCIRTRAKPVSDVEVGHRSATVAHIGNISMRAGRKLRWNPTVERFTKDAEANSMLERPYRGPWSLPDIPSGD